MVLAVCRTTHESFNSNWKFIHHALRCLSDDYEEYKNTVCVFVFVADLFRST